MNQHLSKVFSPQNAGTQTLRQARIEPPKRTTGFAKVRSTSERICVQAASHVRDLAKLLYPYDLSPTDV